MNWSKYAEKKGKTADFAKKERELQPAKKEIKSSVSPILFNKAYLIFFICFIFVFCRTFSK